MKAPTQGRMIIMTLPAEIHKFALDNGINLSLTPQGYNDDGAQILGAIQRDKDTVSILVTGPKLPMIGKNQRVPETKALISDYMQ